MAMLKVKSPDGLAWQASTRCLIKQGSTPSSFTVHDQNTDRLLGAIKKIKQGSRIDPIVFFIATSPYQEAAKQFPLWWKAARWLDETDARMTVRGRLQNT